MVEIHLSSPKNRVGVSRIFGQPLSESGVDRTDIAQFSCHQPSFWRHAWPTLHCWHHAGLLRNVVGWRREHCRTGAPLRRRRTGRGGMFL